MGAGETRAVIDVGTNSVKVLIGAVDGRTVTPLHEESNQTRLGQGFYETHILQPSPIDSTARAVAEYAELARHFGASHLKVIGTSAARDAVNAADLSRAIEAASGLPLVIISGEQEADWAFQGVATHPAFSETDLLVLDVGGGSSEFVLGNRGVRTLGKSFPLGTVRLIERAKLFDPPSDEQRLSCEREVRRILQTQVHPELEAALQQFMQPPVFVGTGGTSSILARIELKLNGYDRDRMENLSISRDRLTTLKERLWSLPLTQPQEVPGIPANRADVILTGIVIYEQVMHTLGLETLKISTRGLRFAALMS